MSAILSLDLGTLCGWCIKRNDGLIISGCIDTSPIPKTKKREKEHSGLRFFKYEKLLNELSANYGDITEIAYEDVRRHMGNSVNIWPALRGITELFAYKIGAETYPYGVGVAKLESVGLGHASKDATVIFANKWLSRKIESEDEADAIAIMYTHLKATEKL